MLITDGAESYRLAQATAGEGVLLPGCGGSGDIARAKRALLSKAHLSGVNIVESYGALRELDRHADGDTGSGNHWLAG